MKFFVAVLIAAVTVNCLVTTINGKAETDTLAVPYTDMLLPPFEDIQPDNGKDVTQEDKINATTKVTPVTTTTTTTTTKKPITNEVNNNLPELSIEALLPPLFEAKIEEDETKTTTEKPTTTTTAIPTSTTIKTTTTSKPSTTTTTTTLKPSKIEVPELLLDPLLPPLLDNSIDNVKDEVTTEKPSIAFKTTKKSYYPQPSKDLHLNDQKQQQLKHLHSAVSTKEVKNYNKPSATSSLSSSIKNVAESRIQTKQVSLASKQQVNKLQSKIETMTHQHVAKQVAQQRHSGTTTKYQDKQFNYSFDFYLGSTTPRPPKSGLPTITPFPHRLGR